MTLDARPTSWVPIGTRHSNADTRRKPPANQGKQFEIRPTQQRALLAKIGYRGSASYFVLSPWPDAPLPEPGPAPFGVTLAPELVGRGTPTFDPDPEYPPLLPRGGRAAFPLAFTRLLLSRERIQGT
jgi:hypothetical protein